MRRPNKQSIEDLDEDDMPCQCQGCKEWFDLHDGRRHPGEEGIIICETCAETLEEALEREEEIADLQETIADAEYTIKQAKERLNELGVKA